VQTSDGTLVQGVLNGDRAAFAELYDRRARLIRAICFDTTRDLNAAADLTQEVFLRAYANLRRLRDPQCFGPWLSGIARQVCREWKRGRQRARRFARPLPDPLPPDTSDDDDRVATLIEIVGRLPEPERRSIQAFYLSGLSAAEARTVLGLSQATLYRVLARARAQLRVLLRKQEVPT
jgi:RNA polymerase sigma-70 factor (ECF subfamily)